MIFNIGSIILFTSLISVAVESPRERLDALLDTRIPEWRFQLGDIPGAEQSDFDDSKWGTVPVGYRWLPNDSIAWFRAAITLPETIAGFSTQGQRIRLICGMDNEATAYVNGEFKQRFEWREGDVLLTESGQPGKAFQLALRGVNRPGTGQLIHAYLATDQSRVVCNALNDLLKKIDILETHLDENDSDWRDAIEDAYRSLSIETIFDATLPGEERMKLAATAIAQAEEILLRVTHSVLERLSGLELKLKELDRQIERGQSKNLRLDYERMKRQVIRSFIQYAKDDYSDNLFWKKARAERAVSYLERLSGEAIQDVSDLLGNPQKERTVPRYRTGRVENRDGAFWQDGHPMIFNGVGHFGQVKKDIPLLQEYGLNMIQIEIGPSRVLREDGSIAWDALETDILQPLRQAKEHNVAVCVLLSPHYFPEWAIEQHPELTDGGYGFIKYDIDHPLARELIERFLRAVVPKMAPFQSLHSFCLSNEPQYAGRSAYSVAKFHEWLAKRHGSIDRLNDLYGTRYTQFDRVPLATRDDPLPAYADWNEFNQDRFRDWHRWMAGIIHECAPDIAVHAKSMAYAWGGGEQFERGVNHEDFAHLGRITGNDCSVIPTREPEYPYAQHWLLQAMHYDFQRSVAPDQPIFNTENHLIPDDNAVFTPGGHIYTALWQGALYGMGASAIWLWERSEGKDSYDNLLTRPNCVEAAGRASLDLMRLAPWVVRFTKIKPEIGLFYAWRSNILTDETRDASAMAYEGLANLGARILIVTEKTIGEGALNDLPIVVAAKTERIHPETAKAFADYVSKGGTVFTIEPSFTSDEYGRADSQLSQWLDGGVRRGTVVRLNTPVTARAIRDLAGERLKQLRRETPVMLTDPYRNPLWGVVWMVLDDGDRYLINVVNEQRVSQSIRIPLRSGGEIVDLISGATFQREFVLPPLQPVLLEIRKKDVVSINSGKDSVF